MNLNYLRKNIDKQDLELLKVLEKRMKLINLVKTHKEKNNLKVEDKKREEEIIGKIIKEGKNRGLSEKFLIKLMNLVFYEAKRIQSAG